jgi:hypothetical protein
MPSVKRHALTILNEYGEAQSELIGKAVVLTDGKAGQSAFLSEHSNQDEEADLDQESGGHDGDGKKHVAR